MISDICTIRMARPSRNAIDPDLIAWLSTEIDSAGARPILLAGSEGAFCAGLNLKRVAEFDEQAMGTFLRAFDDLVRKLFLHPAPTVACVNGHAIAGGCVLALACDERLVADDSRVKLGLNEVALGACFPPLTLRMVRSQLSRHAAERVLLGAELFAPAQALELGLVDEVSADVEGDAHARLTTLAGHSREVYAHTKRLLRTAAIQVDAEDERRFVEEELPLWTSAEIRERIRAVLGG